MVAGLLNNANLRNELLFMEHTGKISCHKYFKWGGFFKGNTLETQVYSTLRKKSSVQHQQQQQYQQQEQEWYEKGIQHRWEGESSGGERVAWRAEPLVRLDIA